MKYLLACSFFLSTVAAVGQVDHTTFQTDLQHTGANLYETTLTPGNVGSPGNFGLLFTQTLDGQSYGQPLYVSAATLGTFLDGSTHNVVYVATEHDSVFAFDADTNGTAQTSVPLWQVSLLQPGQTTVPQGVVGSGDITVELGITATPVIDPVGGTLYIASKVVTSMGIYQQYLYALDLKTGAAKLGSPILINPTFPGSASDGANGVVPFSALHEHLRSALGLYNGVVYLAYASHSDTQPYHGEILGYDATTLQLVKTFNTSPNGNEAGIWGSGASPAIDSQGNMYVGTGNGNFDQNPSSFTTNTDWAISILKLPTNTTGPISLPFSNPLNWFTPNNWAALDNGNLDLNGGLLLLPDQTGGNHTHIMVVGGKGAVLYVLDRDNLGGINTPDNAIQEIAEPGGYWLFATPAYFNGYIYYSASGGPLEQRAVGYDPTTGNYISATPINSTNVYNNKGYGVFISANGNNNGIVWTLNGSGLDAYNATSVAGLPIYTAQSTIPTGNIGTQNTKMSLPLVDNGKVYYTAFNTTTNVGYLLVSGLLPRPVGSPAAPSNLQASGTSSSTAVLTWTDNSNNESGFLINRAPVAAGPYTQVGSVGAGITTYTDTSLTPVTTYFYQVVATNANGNSLATNVAGATTFPLFTPAGLVAYWNLDALGPNSSVTDVTGNGHTGTVNGEVVFTPSGFINGAFSFHGTPVVSNISVPNSPSMQFAANQSFTVSAWVNPANLNGIEQPIVAKSVGVGNQYGIYINANSNWVFRGPSGDLVGPVAVQGVWTNVTAVQDGVAGTRSLYVNGSIAATGTTQAGDGAGNLLIGQATASGGTFGFQGIIDEVRLYNVALAPGGVTDLLGPAVLEAASIQSQGTVGVMPVVIAPSTVPVIEPRQGSVTGSYNVAFYFDAAVSPGITATLTLQGGGNAVGSVNSVTYDSTGKVVTVSLTGVANQQALNIHLAGIIPGNGTADVPLNILWGDVNGDGVVNNLDLTIVQNSFTQAVSQSSALYDINSDGIVNSADAAIVSSFLGTSLGPETPTNLALFQPATASSVNNTNVAANAFDNNLNTRWESVQGAAADPSWLEVDLGSPANISEIVLDWETAAGANYQLQVSSDNQNWTTVVNVTGNTNGGFKTYPNLNAVGRYVRMYGTERTTMYGYSIWEFQVIGIPVSNNIAPYITSPLTATGTAGATFSYQITATPTPASYGASGLPGGLSVNTKTGAITGTPAAPGTTVATLSATNTNGTGSANLTITVNPAPTLPAAPSGVMANAGTGQVSLSWSTSTGATSYSVFRGTASGGEGATPIVQGLTALTYVDTAVTGGIKYFYFVEAVNTVGPSGPSTEVSATPAGVVIPIAPLNLTATGGSAQVALQWNTSAGATSYNVYRGTATGAESSTPLATNVIAATYTDTSVATGVTYFYNVAAVNSAGLSGPSNEASAALLAQTGPVAIYQIDSGSTSGFAAFSADEFFDTGTTSAAGTTIATAGISNAAPMQVYQTNRYGTFTYTIPALTAGASYTVRLHFAETYWQTAGARLFNVAINGVGVLSNFDILASAGGPNTAVVETFPATANSNGAIVISFTAGAADQPQVNGIEILGSSLPVPVAPLGLTATAGNNQVSLSWSAGNGPSGAYSVWRSNTSGGEGGIPIASGIASTHFIDSTASNLATYYYVVTATNSTGTSSFSNEASATPGAPVTGTVVYQVNAGGAAVAPFAADEFFTGGGSAVSGSAINTSAVVSPAPAAVYQSERSGGAFTYTFPNLTPGATYLIRLHFAELYWTSAGQRVFNVAINNTTVLQNFDIIAVAGAANTVVVEQFIATASANGNVTVTYSPGSVDQPKASAIEILGSSAAAPAAPSGIAANAGTGQVSLGWSTSAGATSYSVFRGTASGGEGTTPIAQGLTALTYVDTAVTVGIKYFYFVEAVNTVGPSGPSTEVSATPVAIPAAPLSLTAAGGNSQVALQWNTSTGATSYNVYRGTATGAESPTPLATNVTAATYMDTSVATGVTYFYKVAAVNSAGVSGLSNESSAASIPAAPLNLTAGGGNAQVALQWNTSTGATSYNVYRGTAAGAESPTPLATNVTAATYTDTSVTGGITYFYKVAAVNSAGVSGLSNETSATPAGIPAVPLYLTANGGKAQIALQWSTSAGATSYNVYRGTAAGAESATPLASNITTAIYTDTSVTNGVTYFYKVAAVNSAGVSGQSNEASAAPAVIPSAPLSLTGAGGIAQIALHWNTSAGATSYNVYRGTATGKESTTALATNVTAATYTDTTVTGGTTYYYKVAAVNSAGVSGLSNEASATPLPAAPLSLTATGGSARIALQWSASSGATSYNIYRGTAAGAESTTALATNVRTASYTDTTVTTGVTYFYKVAAVSSAGVSGLSNEASAASIPPTPLSLTAAGGNTQIALHWNTSAGAASYNVYRGTATGRESTTALATNVTAATYTDTTVTGGITYFYKVAAVNSAGVSGLSTEASATPIPAAPLNLTATGGSARIALQWSTSAGATSYNIYRGTAAGMESTALATSVKSATYTDTTVTTGVTYFYKVTAVDTAGVSGLSNEASAASIPASPLSLTAAGGTAQIALQWNASVGATSYNVYRGTTTGRESTTALATNVTTATYTDTSVATGVTYFYKVAAVNSAGVSGLSNEASAK